MKFIEKILKGIAVIVAFCIGSGFLVSGIEKKKGWSETHIPHGIYEKSLKRPLDFSVSLLLVIFLGPLYLFLYLKVRKEIGTPVFFEQPRPGLRDRIFILRKYRTMTDEKDDIGKLKSDEERLTKFGAKLRATSLDELPELVNVLKGDMSIVGPRPQLVKDMVFMSSRCRKRHEVRPGITGLAQVSGRNSISWEDKFEKDLQYVQKITFSEDIKIILKTIKKVLTKEGITEAGMATATDYGDWLLINGKISQAEYEQKQEEAKMLLK